MDPSAEARLARRVSAGDARAFDELVLRYRPRLVRYAEGRLGTHHGDGEDVVQETLIRARRALQAREQPPERLEAWLHAIARNCAADAHRSRERRAAAPLHDGLEALEREPPEVVEHDQRFASVTAAIAALPERQRDALVRSTFAGDSYEAIADGNDLSVGAVKSLVNRARTSVRRAAAAVVPLPWSLADRLVAVGAGRGAVTAVVGASAVKALAVGATSIAAIGLVPVAAVELGQKEAHVEAATATRVVRAPGAGASRTLRERASRPEPKAHAARATRVAPATEGDPAAPPVAVNEPAPTPDAGCTADRIEYAACGAAVP